jgi:hypothetical protein
MKDTKRTKRAFLWILPTFVAFVTFVDSEEVTGAPGHFGSRWHTKQ